MNKLTDAKIEKKLFEKRGNIAATARAFGVSRITIYNYVNKSERLQIALSDARETMLDDAENELYEQALGGNTVALLFFLKTQGKSRGYVERSEFAGVDDAPPIQTIIVQKGTNGSGPL